MENPITAGDPRLSIEERYSTSDTYPRAVMQSATTLHDERLLLEEDVNRIVEGAKLRAFAHSIVR
jgi:hypothetical protein